VANLIKIGHIYLNLDRVLSIEDRFPSQKEDTMIVHFGTPQEESMTLVGREADHLRTWLNSIATNLHDAIERESAG
jgi:hypothetical protein